MKTKKISCIINTLIRVHIEYESRDRRRFILESPKTGIRPQLWKRILFNTRYFPFQWAVNMQVGVSILVLGLVWADQ